MHPGTRYVAVLAATGLAALLAACGGDSPAPKATPSPTTAATTAAASATTATATARPAVSATATAASTTAASATATASNTAAATATRAATVAPTTAPTTAPATATAAPAGGATVDIANFVFVGAGTVSVGGTVTWTNSDDLEHDVTFKDGTASPYLTKGKTYGRKFDSAGAFEYLCSIHPFMVGTVTVK